MSVRSGHGFPHRQRAASVGSYQPGAVGPGNQYGEKSRTGLRYRRGYLDSATRCPDQPALPLNGDSDHRPPGKTGFVGFDIPGGNTLAQNYHDSVQIDFSNAPHVCVDILTRFSDPGFYVNAICADGNRDLGRRLDKFTDLAYGQTAPTHIYTLEATTDGPKQSLAINGIENASVTDGTLTTGQLELAVLNSDISMKSVVLSDYSYTPSLPCRRAHCLRHLHSLILGCGGVGRRDYTNFVYRLRMSGRESHWGGR